MFSTLKRMYDKGSIGEEDIRNAVNRGWITEEEAEMILK